MGVMLEQKSADKDTDIGYGFFFPSFYDDYNTNELYKNLCRQYYFGGFIASWFIPSSNAYKARVAYSREIIKAKQVETSFFKRTFIFQRSRSCIPADGDHEFHCHGDHIKQSDASTDSVLNFSFITQPPLQAFCA